ncbi:hypothetical protein NJC38_25950 [Pseudomonas sp. 21LCFQ010]|uniref:hypothetical protein n=1 Tax=Pseudomonas sp. 21LCFQ010 TaxID=2957506 RepID=UPI0020968C8D|nr:hypothetical protein [Pseudomonas sp. 21LCFQ010]MCO8165585.1 hypothetical protein [Pseudomonas sp. 21LCFQ010]
MNADLQLHIIASLLRRGRALDNLSTGLTLLSLALGLSQLWFAPSGLLMSWVVLLVVLGLGEKYYALRVAFDAELFQKLADDPANLTRNTRALDQALAAFSLQPADKAGRSWPLRSQGALKLLRQQVLLLALQIMLLLGALLILPWFGLMR